VENINIFCFGFGQVAKSLIRKLYSEKYSFNLTTTTRQNTCKKKFEKIQYKCLQFDGDNFDIDIIEELKKATHILVSTPPEAEDYIIKNFSKYLENNNSLKWFGYLSSTGVYGNHDGAWVNEATLTDPTSERGKKRLKAELKFNNLNIPLIIFRLSGIYSTENSVFSRLKKNDLRIVEMKNQIFSRIHIEDIANILFLSLTIKKIIKGEIFNLSDNYPCSYKEVIEYACNLLNISLPKAISFEELGDGQLKDFYQDSKKVSNEKIKEYFKYELKYPTYAEGLRQIKNHIV
tara:strand:+ start:6739 stop:7608 length:870 start_codon:yes stop_codon:yes gene_type:complete